MNVIENISDKVRELLEKYDFNINTLANYLDLSVREVNDIANGNVKSLLGKHIIVDKIMFLYVITCENADLKTNAFLDILISYHHLSKMTIVKMANVKVNDIEKILNGFPNEVDAQTKYKIATTVMSLRFFLKDCEPSIEE